MLIRKDDLTSEQRLELELRYDGPILAVAVSQPHVHIPTARELQKEILFAEAQVKFFQPTIDRFQESLTEAVYERDTAPEGLAKDMATRRVASLRRNLESASEQQDSWIEVRINAEARLEAMQSFKLAAE